MHDAGPRSMLRGVPHGFDPEWRADHTFHISSVASQRHGKLIWHCATDEQMVRALLLAELARRAKVRAPRAS